MKKLYVIVAMLVLCLSVGVSALAQGKKGCCNSCSKSCTPEQMKKFKADTIDLRQEMMNKRFDLQRETLKETPDNAKVTALKADIEGIKAKILAAKAAANMADCKCDCLENCQMLDGNCDQCRPAKKAGKKAKTVKQCNNCDKPVKPGCNNCPKPAAK